MKNYDKKEILDQVSMRMLYKHFGLDQDRGNKPTLKCPFHEDNNSSLSVDFENNRFKCHSNKCGVHGDVIEFYKRYMGLGFKDACNEMGKIFNVSGIYVSRETTKRKVCTTAWEMPEEDVLEVYQELNDITRLTDNGRSYLEEQRGFTMNTIEQFKLHSIDKPRALSNKLEDKFGIDLMQKSGLINSKGNWIFYMPGVLIPFYLEEQIVYYQYRFYEECNGNRYFFLTNTSKPYYMREMENPKEILAVEGIFDAMAFNQLESFSNVMAVCGTGNYNSVRIKNFLNTYDISNEYKLYYSPDFDDAGNQVLKYAKSDGVRTLSIEDYCIDKGIQMHKEEYDWNDVLLEFNRLSG